MREIASEQHRHIMRSIKTISTQEVIIWTSYYTLTAVLALLLTTKAIPFKQIWAVVWAEAEVIEALIQCAHAQRS